MDGWMDGWLSCFFAELLLHWAISSLRYLFSQLVLLWAASYRGDFCSEMLPSFLFCSFCNLILPFAHRAQCVMQFPAATLHSANVVLCWKTTFRAAVAMRLATSSCNPVAAGCQHFAQRQLCRLFRACCTLRFFTIFVKSSSRYSLVHILPTSSSRACQFFWHFEV